MEKNFYRENEELRTDGTVPAADESGEGTVYGAVAAAAGQKDTQTEDNGNEREKLQSEFEELIKGRFADEFARRTGKIIDRRFRQMKELEAENQRNETLLAGLRALYCIEGGGSAENELILEEARRLKGASAPAHDREHMINKALTAYPGFSEEHELSDKRFCELISRGLEYCDAYTLTHLDEIKSEAMREGARQAVRSISTMGTRPAESGAVEGRVSARDVSSLSSSEIRRLIERAAKGEKIKIRDI